MKNIKKSLWGIMAYVLVSPVSIFAANSDISNTGVPKLDNPLNVDTVEDFVAEILKVVVKIGGIIAIFFIIYSGFLFVKARGNDEELNKAKETFKWTIVGVLVLLGAQVISNIIQGTISDIGGVL